MKDINILLEDLKVESMRMVCNYMYEDEVRVSNRRVVTGWRPICDYDPKKYDWVLLDIYERESGLRCIPRMGELCGDSDKAIWHFIGDEMVDLRLYEIQGFFDVEQLG